MTNKKTAVRQAYLERAQVLKETEGAPESTRVALSAISGRNILKTKKETAKIERDKQIAAMQQQALLQQGAASSALKMGQAKLSAAIQQDQNRRTDAFRFMDAGIYDDTLAATLDAQQAQAMQYAEIARQNSALEQQRRSEAIAILKMGVYDPSVAQALGMSESVVKSFADQRAAEIEEARAKKAAAEKAQAEYEEALKNLQAEDDGDEKEFKNGVEESVDAAIDNFEKENSGEVDLNTAKEQIIKSTNLDKVFIPWADPAGTVLVNDDSSSASETKKGAGENSIYSKMVEAREKEASERKELAFGFYQQKAEKALPNAGLNDPVEAKREKEENERISTALKEKEDLAKRAKEQREAEQAQAKKNLEAAELYYEKALAKRIAAKEAADQALSALETAYVNTPSGSIAVAKYNLETATVEEYDTKFQEFAKTIGESIENFFGKYKEDGTYIDGTSSVQELKKQFAEKVKSGGDFSEDERAAIKKQISDLEGLIGTVQGLVEDGYLDEKTAAENISSMNEMIDGMKSIDSLAENLDDEDTRYYAMDLIYGETSLEDLEDEAEQLEQELSQEYDVEVNPTSETSRAKGMMARINKESDARYKKLQNLSMYIDQRKEEIRNEAEVNKGKRVLAFTGKKDLLEQFDYVTSGKPIIDRGIEKVGVEEFGKSQVFRTSKANIERNLSSAEKAEATTAYISLLPERMEKEFTKDMLVGKNIGIGDPSARMLEWKKFDQGRAETFLGNYFFSTDMSKFYAGDYGIFTEEEAKRIMAIDVRYGAKTAFDYYAIVHEEALRREASVNPEWFNASMGMMSGLASQISKSPYMVQNLVSGGNARIRNDFLDYANQETLKDLENRGFTGDLLKTGYMLGYTAYDMMPALALGNVGAGTASAYTFAKTQLNGYRESVEKGRTAEEAFIYGTLSGVFEAGGQYLIGGISELGGKYSLNNTLKSAIDNLSVTSGMKTAFRWIASMGSEGAEEALQEVVSPFLQRIAGELSLADAPIIEDIDWENVGESFVVGALFSGFIEGGGVISDITNGNINLQYARKSLEDGSAIVLIDRAAKLGNARAIRIKQQIDADDLIYSGEKQIQDYVTERDMVNIRKSLFRLGKKKVLADIENELRSGDGKNAAEAGKFAAIFQKIFNAQSLTLEEAADILNDEAATKIFERLLHDKTVGLMPDEVVALARLCCFVDGEYRISKESVDLFKKTFGKIDVETIQNIAQFSDIAAKKRTGYVIDYDSFGMVFDNEEFDDAREVLELLSEITGKVYYITKQYETGTFLSSNLVAINAGDVETGIFYQVGYKAYQTMQAVNPEMGKIVKDFIIKAIEEEIGVAGIENEIEKIRQVKITDGVEIDEPMAKDELCARYMPILFLQKGAKLAQDLVAEDVEAATLLHSVIGSIREQLAAEYSKHIYEIENLNDNQNDTSIKQQIINNQEKLNSMDPIIALDEDVEFHGKQDVVDWIMKKLETTGYEVERPGFGKIIFDRKRVSKSLSYYETNEERIALAAVPVVLRSGIEIGFHNKHKGREYDTITIAAPVFINGIRGNLAVVVRVEGENYYKVHRILMPDGTKFETKKEDNAETAGRVTSNTGLSPTDNVFNNSISNSSENVNSSFYQSLSELAGQETTELYDRLSEAVEKYYSERAELLANSNPDYETDVEITVDPDLLPQVAKDFIRRAENELMETLGFNLRGKQSEWVRSIIEKMANEYLATEEISDRGKQLLHEAVDSYLSPENVDAAINAFQKKMQIANRYVAERMAINADKTNRIETTSELEEAYKDLKAARSKYENASRKQLLTSEDRQTIGRLLRGDLTIEEVSSHYVNADGIITVYRAKAEYEKISKRIRAYNAVRKEKLREEANALLKNISNWKDKKAGWLYMRETMERNIYDIASSPEEAAALIEWVFKPIRDATAAMTQMKEDYRARVEALNLKKRRRIGDEVSESYAVQLLGEAQDNIRIIEESDGRITEKDGKTKEEWQALINDLWISSPKIDKTKIENAVKEFRIIYDELFEMMNEVRLRNGYEPVDYRSGYFPHFQPGETEGVMGLFCKVLDINPNVDILPTTINGLTHTFRPGIQWFGNAKRRLGFETGYDAVRGFDKYIEGIASVIHQTDNIQKLRALSAQIRYLTSDEGIQQQVDDINSDPQLEDEDKANRLEKIYKDGKFSLSNFVNELDEYTNLLANKKSKLDRGAEAFLGRKFYNTAKWAENRIAANMVGGNLSSALTNTIPVQMGMAEVGEINIIKAHLQMIASRTSDDGFVARSAFLTSRRGSDPLARSWSETIAYWAGKPMEWADDYASEVLVRARYNQNIKKGLSEKAAIEEADSWAAGLMADRSKGSMPTIFESRNPLVKVFTMFQLEVNNQFSYLFKDIPRRYGKQAVGRLALVLFRMALGALLFNDTFEKCFGRRPAFDPLGILNDAVGDFSGYKLPNVIDIAYGLVGGEMPSFETEKKDFEDASLELVTDVSNEFPFIGGYLGGGRFPISSAMVDFTNVWKGIVSQDWSTEKKIDALSKEFGKLFYYYAIPSAGGQIKKFVEGSLALYKGGSYTITADGEKKLQYVVEPGDVAQAVLFGKSSLESANEWVKSDFDSLSVDETNIYQKLTKQGVSGNEAYETIKTISDIKDDSGKVDKDAQREYILGLDLSDDQKYTLYKGTLSDSVAEKIDGLVSENVDLGAVMKAYAEYRSIDEDSRYEQSEKGKATEFAYFVDNIVDVEQAEKIKSSITYGVLGATRATEYEKMVASGASFDEAYEAYFSVASLKPEGENKSVKNAAKYDEIMDANLSEEGSRAALMAYASDADLRRMVLAFEEGIDAECFVDIKTSIEHLNDLEGKTTASNARIEAAVRHQSGLTDRQRAVLWQVFSSSDSAKNNPFSVAIGAETLAKVKIYKENEE